MLRRVPQADARTDRAVGRRRWSQHVGEHVARSMSTTSAFRTWRHRAGPEKVDTDDRHAAHPVSLRSSRSRETRSMRSPSAGGSGALATPDVPWSLPRADADPVRRRDRRPRRRGLRPASGPRPVCRPAYTVVVAGAAFVAIIPSVAPGHQPDEGAISAVAGAVGVDRFSLFLTGVICVAVILVALLCRRVPPPRGHRRPRAVPADADGRGRWA